jgi:ADP-ribosylation factor GTPase-activating protein 1
MCLECSGLHRGLGVHLSFVRSVSMDAWSDKQIRMMQVCGWGAAPCAQLHALLLLPRRSGLFAAPLVVQLGGNAKLIAFFTEHGVNSLSIKEKYNSPAAELYRERYVVHASRW